MHVSDAYVREFWGRNSVKRGGRENVKPEKNSIFLKMDKTAISVENRKFSRSRMIKRTASLNLSRKI